MQFKKISIGAIFFILIGVAMVGCSSDEEAKNGKVMNGEVMNENTSSHGHSH